MRCVKDPYLQATDFIKVNLTPTHWLNGDSHYATNSQNTFAHTPVVAREETTLRAFLFMKSPRAALKVKSIRRRSSFGRSIYTYTPRINLNPIAVLLINFPSARAANSIIICNFGSPPPRESFYGGIKTRCCCCCLECTMAVAKLRCHARQWGAFVIDNELQGGVSITKRRLLAR